MAFGLTAYVSRCWLPAIAQGSLPAAGQAFPGGHSPAGLQQKVFNSLHVRWPPFPSFLAQSPDSPVPDTFVQPPERYVLLPSLCLRLIDGTNQTSSHTPNIAIARIAPQLFSRSQKW